MPFADGGEGTDIMRLHHPACRAFHVEEFRARHRLFYRRLVATIDIDDLDIHALHEGAEQAESIGINVAYRDDPVTGRHEGKHGG